MFYGTIFEKHRFRPIFLNSFFLGGGAYGPTLSMIYLCASLPPPVMYEKTKLLYFHTFDSYIRL